MFGWVFGPQSHLPGEKPLFSKIFVFVEVTTLKLKFAEWDFRF